MKQKNNKIDRRHVGLSAINPYGSGNSSSRGYMTLGHIGNSISLNNPEIPLFMSGLEEELTKTTFSYRAPCDLVIYDWNVVYSNTRNEMVCNDDISQIILVYKDLNKKELNSITIKRYDNYDTKFGFEHKFTNLLYRIIEGEDVGVIPKGTSFTMTNGEVEPGIYGYGVHAVVSTASHPDVSEDAITISTGLRDKCAYYIYKKFTINVKANNVPLNQYGTLDRYLSLPKVGDILQGGYIFATREIGSGSYAALFNKKALMQIDVDHDTIYPLDKGEAEVIEVKVIRNSRRNNELIDGVYEQLSDLADDFDTDAMAFAELANKIEKDAFHHKYNIGDILHTDIVYYKKLSSPEIVRKEGRADLPPYTITVSVKYKRYPDVGAKAANRHGGKGVISNVVDTNKMPIDKNGLRASMLLSDVSSTHRMNLGGEHEGYMTSVNMVVTNNIRRELEPFLKTAAIKEVLSKNANGVTDKLFNYVLGFVKICSKVQYEQYKMFSKQQKISLVTDVYVNGVYMYTPYDAEESKRDISEALSTSEYKLDDSGLFYTSPTGEVKETIASGHMKGQYVMLLNKIADDWLAVSAANLNHLGLPVPPSKESKKRYPFNFRPSKIHSETETRFIAFYCGVETLAELRDRNLSLVTFKHIYDTMLTAKNPFAIDCMVNRKNVPFGNDSSVMIMNTLMASAGLEIITIKD